MDSKPYIGQRVRLNNHGMKSIGGIISTKMFHESQNMRVTNVSTLLVEDPPIWEIEVNQPEINQFLLNSLGIDEIGETFDAEVRPNAAICW